MNWKIKRFEELTTTELYEILRVRAEVFVVEQTCVYQDLDLKDKKAYHLFCENNGEIVAYLRILDKGVSYPEISIGRVLTRETNRRIGLAREMMQKAICFWKIPFRLFSKTNYCLTVLLPSKSLEHRDILFIS
mgnify:CR=1 FL=1